MECIKCGKTVSGWYEWRWETEYDGPVCRSCWQEHTAIPGHSWEDGGVEYPEEAQPGFQILRRRMIEDWRK